MWEFTCWSGRKGKNIISHCSSNLHNFEEEEENKKHLMQGALSSLSTGDNRDFACFV